MPEYKTECKVNEHKTDTIEGMLDKRLVIINKLQQAQSDKYDIEHEIKSTVIELRLYDCMTINYSMLHRMIGPKKQR